MDIDPSHPVSVFGQLRHNGHFFGRRPIAPISHGFGLLLGMAAEPPDFSARFDLVSLFHRDPCAHFTSGKLVESAGWSSATPGIEVAMVFTLRFFVAVDLKAQLHESVYTIRPKEYTFGQSCDGTLLRTRLPEGNC